MKLTDKTIKKISLLLFFLGFFGIYLVELNSELPLTTIDTLTIQDLNKNIKLNGYFTEQNKRGNTLFVRVKDSSGEIKGILFSTENQFDSRKKYEITGKITLYKNELEIIINNIEISKKEET